MVTITLNCISEGSRLISLPGFEPKLFVQSIATEKVKMTLKKGRFWDSPSKSFY